MNKIRHRGPRESSKQSSSAILCKHLTIWKSWHLMLRKPHSIGLQKGRSDPGITLVNIQAMYTTGFPGGASGKGPACQCRRQKRHGFDPWCQEDTLYKEMATHSSILAQRIPQKRSLASYRPSGHTESDITERLSTTQGILHV